MSELIEDLVDELEDELVLIHDASFIKYNADLHWQNIINNYSDLEWKQHFRYALSIVVQLPNLFINYNYIFQQINFWCIL